METSSLRILLAITDPVQAVLAAQLIQRLGHPAPHRVQSWQAALEAVREFQADVWIVEAHLLPDANAATPALMPRPWIIAITTASHDLHDDDTRCACDDTLSPPLSLQALSVALSAALGRRPAPGALADDFCATTWNDLLCLFGASGLAELVAALRKDLPTTRARLQQAARGRGTPPDWAALRHIAHSLRGACQQLGADDLAQLCVRAEQAAREELPAAVDHGAAALLRYGTLIDRLEDELRHV